MGTGSEPSSHSLAGRDDELAAVRSLTERLDAPARALVLEGDAGIGKTTLWAQGLALAREQGRRVLVARASETETALPYSALIDLFDEVDTGELTALPAPQLRSLEVTLFRTDPGDRPPEPQVVALAVLSALRTLATRDPLLVALDDVQWLDRASETALTYAVRRLADAPVGFLLARRPLRRTDLEDAFLGDRTRHVEVGPLSLGATRQLLAARMGLRLPHHLLRRVYDVTAGNPLFAVEVGRTLSVRDLDAIGDELPLPDRVDDLLGMRLGELDDPSRRVLLALALDGDLRRAQLHELAGPAAVDAAVASALVELDGERVRPVHPLLAAAAKRSADEATRMDLHRSLADVVSDEPRRALHLALASVDPREDLAARISRAAGLASARGQTRLAVDLAEHAYRLTPAETSSDLHADRVLTLARHLHDAGEKRRLDDLLSPRIESLAVGQDRVAAYLLLVGGVISGNADILALLERALVEAGEDEVLRGRVLSLLAENEAGIEVRDIARADARAAEAVTATDTGSPDDRRLALYARTWTKALRGQDVADLVGAYDALPVGRTYLPRNPARIAGQRLVWRGEIGRARVLLGAYRDRAEELGEPSAAALARLHLCELELRAGGWSAAESLLEEWAASTDDDLLQWPMYERCRALAAAGRGEVDDAGEWGRRALTLADDNGVRWDWLEASRALGQASLLGKDPAGGVQHLGEVWEHTNREGVLDPGAFPAAPDLVEALVETEAYDAAGEVVDALTRAAEDQDHPWAGLAAARGAALIDIGVNGYADPSGAALEAAATSYRGLGLLFDEARTLLALGRVQRRARKWGAASRSLERAAAAFDAIGSVGWAQDARAELERVGARRPASEGGLTPTERRVVDLAVEGRSNKEIARELVVTVNTVEFHLRNSYAKLGIRSRGRLAAALQGLESPGV